MSLAENDQRIRPSEVNQPVVVAVTLSGGGARAAAFGLGVLRELKATRFALEGQETTLLDQVFLVSGVSGGSILAAHFAAFGDATLTRFEPDFLLVPFEGRLIREALWPERLYRLLIRPNEVLSGIAHARVLKVADHTLRIVVQHPHMRTGCLA
ncbi:TPA: hypothetical protein I8549_005802 [Serratia marcescens]|nr:hypothetical protein [Serratia marcescens]HAT3695420.1 hypothetical protein [Serratia marcescens]